ncbi:MAG: hypothetical protein LUC93_16715 [Planctomycetaceae bacterium]|nr:hypothetical protein [Planctomycetaceae bacterium]
MRGFWLWVLFLFAVVCRAAAGGEARPDAAVGDTITIFWKSLFDNGPLGLFLAYMLHRETKRDKLDADNREAEDKRRLAVGDRFRQLDERFIDIIEKYASDTADVQHSLQDIRVGLRHIVALLSGGPVIDSDLPSAGPRVFRKNKGLDA